MRFIFIAVVVSVGALASPGTAQVERPARNSADEPFAKEFSLSRGVEFLDRVSLDWTQRRQCGTCHTNYLYMVARPTVGEAGGETMKFVRSFFEKRAANWDKNEPLWDTEVVATAITLAWNDAQTSGKLQPVTRAALERMWKLQRKDGAWDWLDCDWPPMEHDDYFGAVFVAVGLGMAPEHYAESPQAQAGLRKLRRYLAKNPAPDLHHQTFLLWASQRLEGLMTKAEQKETIKKLLALQRADGGWNLPSLGSWRRRNGKPNEAKGGGDGYGTGLVVYVLRQAGVEAKHASIRRGVEWLKKHQRKSGRWFTRSLNTDRYHFISHAGTAYAIMALQACQEREKQGLRESER